MASSKRSSSGDEGGPLITSPFDKFEVVMMDRRELKAAPYNPRTISDAAKRKLKKGIEKIGMVQPACVWNRRSGRLVGGHRRIENLDVLMGTNAYQLKVAIVDLDDKTEKEANILLNNPEAQGDWDIGKLGEMFKTGGLDVEATGMDQADLYRLFGDTPLKDRSAEELDDLAERLREHRKRYEQIGERSRARNGINFFTVVIFADGAERDAFHARVGWDDNRFQDGRAFRVRLESGAALVDPPAADEPKGPPETS